MAENMTDIANPELFSFSLTHRRSRNIAEHVVNIPGWSLHYNQFTQGKFDGRLTVLELDGIQLIRERTTQALLKQGQAVKHQLFTFPLYPPSDDFYCAGHHIDRERLLVAPSHSLPELRAPEAVDLLLISVDETYFPTIFDEINERMLHAPRLFPLVNHDNLARWRMLSDSIEISEDNTRRPALLTFAAVRQAIRDTVLIYLSEMIEPECAIALTDSAKKRIVDRAREYMMAHRDNPPSILDVCKHAGASRRKLQYCFQETLGINPISYLRVLRLNGAHHDLLEGATTVQDTACHWGFWHLSRFANDYRQLFGEYPSTTLNRSCNNFANFG
ncbi:helix-turn-helix domain-containing protein [Dickeya undicola]|uniref:Helix-turn-helix domain-containing protein n=1 Tax=Dickeya undicola TaxID=1577887 RepID=A0A3N0FWA2_9GAMM|nr:helix-turn-helix domain-containing protein [Dickeya undicola]RNM04271.1 helix-turn-helix domain-containing protein [Dickeya undicola]RNM19857.1 helix-turn-helix domain-containing protein [Dickeya undicola]